MPTLTQNCAVTERWQDVGKKKRRDTYSSWFFVQLQINPAMGRRKKRMLAYGWLKRPSLSGSQQQRDKPDMSISNPPPNGTEKQTPPNNQKKHIRELGSIQRPWEHVICWVSMLKIELGGGGGGGRGRGNGSQRI